MVISWCSNVGNERGEVLLSLLTTSESLSNLEKMAEGLMNRFQMPIRPILLFCTLTEIAANQEAKNQNIRCFFIDGKSCA